MPPWAAATRAIQVSGTTTASCAGRVPSSEAALLCHRVQEEQAKRDRGHCENDSDVQPHARSHALPRSLSPEASGASHPPHKAVRNHKPCPQRQRQRNGQKGGLCHDSTERVGCRRPAGRPGIGCLPRWRGQPVATTGAVGDGSSASPSEARLGFGMRWRCRTGHNPQFRGRHQTERATPHTKCAPKATPTGRPIDTDPQSRTMQVCGYTDRPARDIVTLRDGLAPVTSPANNRDTR